MHDNMDLKHMLETFDILVTLNANKQANKPRVPSIWNQLHGHFPTVEFCVRLPVLDVTLSKMKNRLDFQIKIYSFLPILNEHTNNLIQTVLKLFLFVG